MTDEPESPGPPPVSEPTYEASEGAPFGYMFDDRTGELRPRKRPARGHFPPSEVRAPKSADAPTAEDDRPPGGKRKGPSFRRSHHKPKLAAPPGAKPVGMPPPGRITKGVNRLYRRCGKMVRAVDETVGAAFIMISQNTAGEGEPDDSVGAAWEELARANPRIRAALVRMLAGGAWGMLIEAHLPVIAAIVVKDSVRRRIPFGRVLSSMAEPEPDSAPGEGGLPFGMTMDDAQAMARTFAQTFPGGIDFGPAFPEGYTPQQEGPEA